MTHNYKRVLTSVVATAALLVNAALPVLATSTIEISGNGADSTNEAKLEFEQSTTVVQSNEANVTNTVNASADTGGNKASGNTGGDVSITTGDATTDVSVANTLNSNSAQVDCCQQGPIDVLISGNGADSDNKVKLDMDNATQIYQTNEAKVKNSVWADADTGGNRAKDNTGGSVSIETGDASTTVDLSTNANYNSARVGGGSAAGGLSARILGNGADSDNKIKIELEGGVLISQANEANVYNHVDADADTGDNKAKDNTGGDVSIETGDATVDVTVDNMLNFNWADADCGCLLGDLLAKIAGNGEGSKNKIKLELGGEESGLLVFQGNCAEDKVDGGEQGGDHHRHGCKLTNRIDADADTGGNKVKDNTGDPQGDPTIETGDAETDVHVENSGNSNVYGTAPDWNWELPIPGFSFNLNLSFSLSDLLAALLG